MTPEEKRLIGMSDVAALLGLDPNRSKFDVYMRVVEGRDTPDTPILLRGRRFEPVIRQIAREDFGLALCGPKSLRDARRDYVRGTLDDQHSSDVHLEAPIEPVEFKSVSPWAADDLGESGTDHIKESWLVQVQGYLALTGAERAHLVALVGLDDARHFVIPAKPDLQGLIFEAIDKFWVDCVQPKRPPAIDGSAGCAEWLKQRFPRNNGGLLTADAEASDWAMRYLSARSAREEAAALEETARNWLINRIGEADGIAGDGWKVTHRYANGRASIDKAALEADGLLAKYTKRGNGGRRFVPKFKGMKETENAHE